LGFKEEIGFDIPFGFGRLGLGISNRINVSNIFKPLTWKQGILEFKE
jgi:hypothetical protein